MKLFLGVLLAAIIIGGFVGAEVFDTSFSIMGAVIGGVGTAAILLGLGAYFDAQERKSQKLPAEVRGVFDRMITGKENPTRQEIQAAKKVYLKAAKSRQTNKNLDNSPVKSGGLNSPLGRASAAIESQLLASGSVEREVGQSPTNMLQATFVPRRSQQTMQPTPSSKMLRDAGLPPLLADTIQNLMAQDAEAVARGEVLERRLIPHHAIKRDIIIAAYTRDFEDAKKKVRNMVGQDHQKAGRIRVMGDDFENLISGVKQLSWQELDEIIVRMKGGRTDLKEIEQEIRMKKPIYKIVDPIFV